MPDHDEFVKKLLPALLDWQVDRIRIERLEGMESSASRRVAFAVWVASGEEPTTR